MKFAAPVGMVFAFLLFLGFLWFARTLAGHARDPAEAEVVSCSRATDECACDERQHPSSLDQVVASAVVLDQVVLGNGESVRKAFDRTCAACHISGMAGAPRKGNTTEWAPRIAKGKAALYRSAVNGVPPGMPAKGLCFECSGEDLNRMVDFLTENEHQVSVEPGMELPAESGR